VKKKRKRKEIHAPKKKNKQIPIEATVDPKYPTPDQEKLQVWFRRKKTILLEGRLPKNIQPNFENHD